MYYIFQITPGLGKSEEFFSWAIGSFNIGALLGSIFSIILQKLNVPSWYLFMQIELFCTLGALIRAITYIPELVILSTVMIGYFSGAIFTLSYTYFAQSTIDYEKILHAEIGKEALGKGRYIRNILFSLATIFVCLGRIIGNGEFHKLRS